MQKGLGGTKGEVRDYLYREGDREGWREDALMDITNIKDVAKKILILAAETIARPGHSIHLHPGILELKENEIMDVFELVGMNDPDVASMLERSMATDL